MESNTFRREWRVAIKSQKLEIREMNGDKLQNQENWMLRYQWKRESTQRIPETSPKAQELAALGPLGSENEGNDGNKIKVHFRRREVLFYKRNIISHLINEFFPANFSQSPNIVKTIWK